MIISKLPNLPPNGNKSEMIEAKLVKLLYKNQETFKDLWAVTKVSLAALQIPSRIQDAPSAIAAKCPALYYTRLKHSKAPTQAKSIQSGLQQWLWLQEHFHNNHRTSNGEK